MASIYAVRGTLYLDFRFKGMRCRERTGLPDNEANHRKLQQFCQRMEAQITLGQFNFCKTFPNSVRCDYFQKLAHRESLYKAGCPDFASFAEQWFLEKKAEWRTSTHQTVRQILNIHLIPAFGKKAVNMITKDDIMLFRSHLGTLPGRRGLTISSSRINHIMTPLRMIINEAADRFAFSSPWRNIRAMRVSRTAIQPFSLVEIERLLAVVRKDFQPYYMVRFFTGLRSGEIHGLTWRHVDFERRQILIYQARVRKEIIPTKNDGSYRAIQMSERVYLALRQQAAQTGQYGPDGFVFCTREGSPLDDHNVTKRVWYPLLAALGFEPRNPYQTRHTAATLWLVAGESPEWIARQLGHASTQMLFRVYSRYVPNLAGRDGSAFERMLNRHYTRESPEVQTTPEDNREEQ